MLENPQSESHLLSICVEFGSITSFKIYKSKFSILHWNNCQNVCRAIVNCLGIKIFPSTGQTVKTIFKLFPCSKQDHQGYESVAGSAHFYPSLYFYYKNECPAQDQICQHYGRLSLFHLHYYWSKFQPATSNFVRKDKQLCLNCQLSKEEGRMRVWLFHVFAICAKAHALLVWPTDLCFLAYLREIWILRMFFLSTFVKEYYQPHLGPIISDLIQTCRIVQVHYNLPVYHIRALFINGRCISATHWENRSIHCF